jgi:uncharacterized protein YoxC
MREKRVTKINMGGEDYELAPNKIFFAGDSWDRGIEYMVEPAITANTNGSISLNCSANDIMIGNTTLANAIDTSPTATYAVTTVNSAVNRLDNLESSVSCIQADTNSLYDKVNYLDQQLDALSLVVNQKKASPQEVGKAFAVLADKMKQLQQIDRGKRTICDLIEPGEAAWIEKMNLKTRRTGTFRKSELLTI